MSKTQRTFVQPDQPEDFLKKKYKGAEPFWKYPKGTVEIKVYTYGKFGDISVTSYKDGEGKKFWRFDNHATGIWFLSRNSNYVFGQASYKKEHYNELERIFDWASKYA